MAADLIGLLAEHRAARSGPIAELLAETIERDHPGYRALAVVPRADLRRSCHDNVRRVLELLAAAVEQGAVPDAEHDRAAYDAARETGRRRAEQGLPLDDVLRSFRIGGRLIWADLVERAGGVEATLDAADVREVGTLLWEVVDETSAQVATAYHRHEQLLVREGEHRRAELWEGLLAGRGREPGFAHEVGRLLDLPVTAEVVVAVAPHLEIRRTEARLTPHASAWVRRSGDVVGVVALREDGTDAVVTALSAVGEREHVPIGVSGVVAGLAEADYGYRQAATALRARGGRAGAVGFDDLLPEALLLGSPDVTRLLLARWLDPVRAMEPREAAELLDTLRAWVATRGSATRAAALAHCHRNTVVNRLRRYARLTGVGLDEGEVPLELALALRADRLSPPEG